MNTVYMAADIKKVITASVVILDISAAFDSVDHHTLIDRLEFLFGGSLRRLLLLAPLYLSSSCDSTAIRPSRLCASESRLPSGLCVTSWRVN